MRASGARMGRGARLAVVAAALAALCLAVLVSNGHRRVAPAAAAGPIPVDAERAARRDVPISLGTVGEVTSLAVAPVKPRVDGQLVRIAFRESQDVRRGQLLAQIDPRPYQAALAQAEATVRKDRALAADLRLNEQRARQLASLGAGPKQNADTLAAQAAAADATADADAALAQSARLNLEFTRIVSPIDGRAGLRQADVGTLVHSTDATPLVSVTQMRPISVILSLPQGDLAALLAAQARGPAAVVVDGGAGTARVHGVLSAIDSTVQPATGEVKLRAVFPNADLKLWPGELVGAQVALDTLRGALTVSDQAVLNGPTGPYVYVVGPGERVRVRRVRTGPSVGGFTVVAEGLSPGERVVDHGQSRLKPGAAVTVQRVGAGPGG